MIWVFRVECVWGYHLQQEWVRVIEIESESSLCDLHDAILDAIGFDREHLSEFHAGRSLRNRKVVFGDVWDDLILEQVYPLPKSCKLYLHYDFGTDWFFEIRKSRRQPQQSGAGASYPRVVEAIGPNPWQYGEYEE